MAYTVNYKDDGNVNKPAIIVVDGELDNTTDILLVGKNYPRYGEVIADMRLVDFKVRITQGGTEAVTRVIIDSEDAEGRRWSTVGVSANIVDASFDALLDAINWKLLLST